MPPRKATTTPRSRGGSTRGSTAQGRRQTRSQTPAQPPRTDPLPLPLLEENDDDDDESELVALHSERPNLQVKSSRAYGAAGKVTSPPKLGTVTDELAMAMEDVLEAPSAEVTTEKDITPDESSDNEENDDGRLELDLQAERSEEMVPSSPSKGARVSSRRKPNALEHYSFSTERRVSRATESTAAQNNRENLRLPTRGKARSNLRTNSSPAPSSPPPPSTLQRVREWLSRQMLHITWSKLLTTLTLMLIALAVLYDLMHTRLTQLPGLAGAPPLRLRSKLGNSLSTGLTRVTSGIRAYPAPLSIPDGLETVLHARMDNFNGRLDVLRERLTAVERAYDRQSASLSRPHERRINFFAVGTGVLVDPYLTSPTRQLAPQSVSARLYRWYAGIPRLLPPSPATALLPWDDVGDCWCAPESNGPAAAQLTLLLPRKIVPTELVVEHMPAHATLDPGATPRDLELWVQINDPATRVRVQHASAEYFDKLDDERDERVFASSRALDTTWVRIGHWRYAIESPNNVQEFGMQLALDALNATVSKVSVRALNNWGSAQHVCFYRLKLYGLLSASSRRNSEILQY